MGIPCSGALLSRSGTAREFFCQAGLYHGKTGLNTLLRGEPQKPNIRSTWLKCFLPTQQVGRDGQRQLFKDIKALSPPQRFYINCSGVILFCGQLYNLYLGFITPADRVPALEERVACLSSAAKALAVSALILCTAGSNSWLFLNEKSPPVSLFVLPSSVVRRINCLIQPSSSP